MHNNEPIASASDLTDTPVSKYLRTTIDALAGTKSQRQIAREIGYSKPNVISMFKTGRLRIPLERVPAVAKALEIDPALLFRMVLDEYWPNRRDAVAAIFGTIVTKNEAEILACIRTLTDASDPPLTGELDKTLSEVFGGTPQKV